MLAMKNLVVSSMEVERHGEYIFSYNVKAWLFSFGNALQRPLESNTVYCYLAFI
jgi:hypothetical protein